MSIFILSESAGILFEGAFSLWVSLKLILLQPLKTIPIWVCHVLWKQFCCSCMYIKTARNKSQFFFLSGFSFIDTDDSQESSGREGTTSTGSRTFRYLFASLHVRWLSRIFNRIACIYQTATQWDLPPYRITIWLIDDVMLVFVCLRDDLILAFLLQQFQTGNRLISTHINYHSFITNESTN